MMAERDQVELIVKGLRDAQIAIQSFSATTALRDRLTFKQRGLVDSAVCNVVEVRRDLERQLYSRPRSNPV